jgi:hypothetical protein
VDGTCAVQRFSSAWNYTAIAYDVAIWSADGALVRALSVSPLTRSLSPAPAFVVWFELATGSFEGVRRIGIQLVWSRGLVCGVDADEVNPEIP